MIKAAFQASLVILTFLSLSLGVQAQEDDVEALRERTQAMFEFEIGEWRSTWERLDADGNVISSVSGSEKMSWTLDGTAVEMVTRLDGAEHWNKAIRFFNPQRKSIAFIDVGTTGDYWIMHQDPITHVVQSEPTLRPNGETVIIRFTIVRKTQNEMDVIMEQSLDMGETWAHRTNQYMRRVVD